MNSVTVAELDIDYCSLTYGIAPCLALLSYADGTSAKAIGTAAGYLKRGAGLTGAADSKLLTMAVWVKAGSAGTIIAGVTTLNGATYRVRASLDGSSKFKLELHNAAGTVTCSITSDDAIADDGRYHLILASVDMANSSKRHIIVDGEDAGVVAATYLDDVIDFTLADWGVGALPDGTSAIETEIANLWFQPGTYTDFSVPDNVLAWRTITGRPVKPAGSPLVFLDGDYVSFQTNSGTGGNFTVTGELAEAAFSTGTKKCFNTRATCQSKESFTNEPVTLRFAMPASYVPKSLDAIQCMSGVSISPGTVSLGGDLGTRSSVTVRFEDFIHPDVGPGFDKYHNERDYVPIEQGTFFGRFRARQPYLRAEPMRIYRGFEGQDLSEMEVYNYIVESFNGPTMDGTFTITAKDALKMADGDRAQAPRLSNGYIGSSISSSATSFTLLPVGIGDLEYPTVGYAHIGGTEIVRYKRTADSVTIVNPSDDTTASTLGRANYNTEAKAHDANERFQVCLHYNAEDPADIISDLFQNYAGMEPELIDIDAWRAETGSFYRRVMTTLIAEPTSVRKLVSEIIEEAALSIWHDPAANKLRLQVLRQLSVEDAVTHGLGRIMEGTMVPTEQPEKRISQVWTYYGMINPLKGVEDADNYKSSVLTVDLEAQDDYGQPAIKKIFSRWIPFFGRIAATRVNSIQLGRFRDPPRKFTYSLYRESVSEPPQLGVGYLAEAWPLQLDTGAPESVPVQFVRISPEADRFKVEAEENKFITFDEDDFNNRVIIIDGTNYNLNMRTIHDTLYPAPVEGVVVTFIVEAGAKIGSTSTGTYALDTGLWPDGTELRLVNKGRIQGRGGDGGRGAWYSGGHNAPTGGASGGPALLVRVEIEIDNTGGKIFGGAGGGGGANILALDTHKAGGGGGGAGLPGGAGGYSVYQYGAAGGEDAGGSGGSSYGSYAFYQWPSDTGVRGGAGGSPGNAGGTGGHHGGNGFEAYGGPGGAAGAAINGISLCTVTVVGDIRGPQVG